eukprot:9977568-Alexandrium_andersonii.AAC.1
MSRPFLGAATRPKPPGGDPHVPDGAVILPASEQRKSKLEQTHWPFGQSKLAERSNCLLYTSDAADDM